MSELCSTCSSFFLFLINSFFLNNCLLEMTSSDWRTMVEWIQPSNLRMLFGGTRESGDRYRNELIKIKKDLIPCCWLLNFLLSYYLNSYAHTHMHTHIHTHTHTHKLLQFFTDGAPVDVSKSVKEFTVQRQGGFSNSFGRYDN